MHKVEEELKFEQENVSKSDEDKRQEIFMKIEALETVQKKTQDENEVLGIEVIKKFEELIDGYKRLGGYEVKDYIGQSAYAFLDICERRGFISLEIWRVEKEKVKNLLNKDK